jgi:hypothetical protein
MGLPAVDLDDEQLIGPEEVDHISIQTGVHLGLGKAVTPAKGEHADLELAPSAVRHRFWTERQAKELGLADGGGELRRGEKGAEVRERSSRARDRDSMASSAVTGNEGGGAMKHDPPPVPLARGARHGDVNRPRLSLCGGLR